jgi:peptidyl-prolyl cis-trans isomerase SurA
MLAAALLATPAPGRTQTPDQSAAQVLDRVVASVGDVAITASDVENEYRLELFLDGKSPEGPKGSDAVLDQVRQRMIDRVLLEEEVRAEGIEVSPDDPAVQARWTEVQQKFPSAEAFARALSELGITRDDVKAVLANEEEILRLIDRRLRPEAVVESSEIETYYRSTLLPSLAREGSQQAPPLNQVEGRIREILVERKIDSLLDDWLKRLRGRADVRVFGSARAGSS